ncbi:CPBP family intramembrane glutamic endopeptidase [Leptolyngbya sp. FACHB-261]|uniref:CPBP family intramembrane glutamic endopeptidase n=1 Tax=Leptolyngbya sp. FACHB-261 TaxID=2692806 RepID=UPI0016834DBD|nr:type II CAAX endopeptidase family protein [Leptolyngbya sp. FACHB-261]MBD2101515.1 CPBP family intramembrane metalloprotease [Leptolyngbya sp. FACHB-261]
MPATPEFPAPEFGSEFLDIRPPWNAWDLLKTILGGLVLSLMLVATVLFGAKALASSDLLEVPRRVAVNLAILSTYFGLLGSAWYFVLRRYRAQWQEVGLRPVSVKGLLAVLPVMLAVLAVNVGLTLVMTRLLGPINNPQKESFAPGGVMTLSDLGWLFPHVAVAAPIVEEILFRGMLYPYLRSRTSRSNAVLLSAGIFASIHFIPVLWPFLFNLGIALALVTERYKSIYPAILLHGLNNALVVTGMYFSLHQGS